MRVMACVMAALVAAGCATKYRPHGFSGGYSETKVGDDGWIVTFKGNGFTSRSRAMEYTYRRAGELCPRGFDVVDADRYSTTSYAVGQDSVREINKPAAVLAVRCRAAPALLAPGDDPRTLPPEHMPKPATVIPEPRARVENGVTVILVDHPFYCFTVSGTGIQMCASELERCRTVAISMESVATCDPAPAAACFRVRDAVTGRIIGWCFSTLSWCLKGQAAFANPDTSILDKDCVVMRQEP
jgi:hypothetical protein